MAHLGVASRRGGPSAVNLHHINVHVGVSCLHEWTSVTHFESFVDIIETRLDLSEIRTTFRDQDDTLFEFVDRDDTCAQV
jgi:hypothetical protein